MEERLTARLLNAEGELIAEGVCHVEPAVGRATLEATREPGELLKERGLLTIHLDDGTSFNVSDRPIVLRIWPSANGGEERRHRTLYRFQMDPVPEAFRLKAPSDGRAATG